MTPTTTATTTPTKQTLTIRNLSKTYASGLAALKNIDLEIEKGEIFALLGPNGAGKTTLISIICGIVNPTAGQVLVDGHDIQREYRAARSKVGLVPQELTTDAFETVWATVNFSRRLFGRPPNPAYIEKVLRELTLVEADLLAITVDVHRDDHVLQRLVGLVLVAERGVDRRYG